MDPKRRWPLPLLGKNWVLGLIRAAIRRAVYVFDILESTFSCPPEVTVSFTYRSRLGGMFVAKLEAEPA